MSKIPMGAEWVQELREDGRERFDIRRDLLCTANLDGYFVSLNEAWERLTGWSREELSSRPFVSFVHPDDVERTVAEAAKVVQAGYELVEFENRYRTKDGRWLWLRWAARADGQMWFAVASDITERKRAEERMRDALTQERLLAYSQPILDQLRGRIVQEELLVRLRGDDDRVLEPAEFLPEAERYALIGGIDRWMVDQAISLARQGRRLEVNLSAQTIDDQEVVRRIEEMLRAAKPLGRSIVFEITETSAMEHLDAAREAIARLSRYGCTFALDDFGTGFGCFTHLKHLPVAYLKIDASFVRGLTTNEDDRAVVRSIVAIGEYFHRRTVAEGVEDEATLELLRDLGVDHAQGYFVGRPLPASSPR